MKMVETVMDQIPELKALRGITCWLDKSCMLPNGYAQVQFIGESIITSVFGKLPVKFLKRHLGEVTECKLRNISTQRSDYTRR